MHIANELFHFASWYARKDLEFDGRTYKAGSYFPHRELGVDDLTIRSYYMSGLVTVGPHPSELKPKRKAG